MIVEDFSLKDSRRDNISLFFERKEKREISQKRLLKFGVWLYFFLLIFEGALRKWILPNLSTPLLIIRDPIALWIVFVSLNRKIVQLNFYVSSILLISTVSFIAAITLGHGNVAVALFGLRILVIHFPFMYAMGALFAEDDVIQMGKATLWIAIPMVVLIGLQFYSPQTAWVNRGVGGDENGAGFSGALGYFRPSGTFSFTNGNTFFFGLTAAFIFYFLLETKRINRFLLIGAILSLIAAIPFSISRALLLNVAVCAFFMLVAVSRKPQYTGKVLAGIVGSLFLLTLISQLSFFQTATEALVSRFTLANDQEGGLVEGVILNRYFGGMIEAITNSSQLPFLGYGLGMGTNVGAILLTGKATFLISEGEWGRLIGEMGLLLGLLVIILRMMFSLKLALLSYDQLIRNNVLSWMLLSFGLLIIPQGQWAQPTSLGFSTLIGGLLLASSKKKPICVRNIDKN